MQGIRLFLVGEDGFEPSKRNAADLQSVPFGHSGTPPYLVVSQRLGYYSMDSGFVKGENEENWIDHEVLLTQYEVSFGHEVATQ